MDIEIRPMRDEDREAVADLAAALNREEVAAHRQAGHPFAEGFARDRAGAASPVLQVFAAARQHRGLVLVACAERPVGYLALSVEAGLSPRGGTGPIGYVAGLMVEPAYRGRGLGRRLLDEARRFARERGLAALVLSVSTDNPGARRFYEREGFLPFATAMMADPAAWPCRATGSCVEGAPGGTGRSVT
ncbi:GNAT family N-acetyltransferase [Prosthecomicrobium sp. N25]|uniref:GNAT family N-acetyltransferase n=1 Tax=Prosthecomicrobium sp. N25 TaxID=3129254 RepID=UPI0030771A43